MENVRGAAESIFAEWVRRRENGESEELAVLLEAHPAERGEILDLHDAWEILSRARQQEPSASTSTTAAGPDRLGHYRKLELLGRGGQGEVWLAEDLRLRRRVALKVLRAIDPDRLRRFEREAAVTSRLDHPSICPVYEWGESDGVAYIAMRYVEGRSLAHSIEEAASRRAERVARSGSSSGGPSKVPEIARLVRIVSGAARALHAAHGAGVIHRDVKPGNILITRDDQPVVVDFGFAEDTEGGRSELTRSREFLGTPAYMSPEQLLGKRRAALDPRTDVWSLGVTLYECLTGVRPFVGPTWQAIFHSITSVEAEPARKINPALPLDLDVILATALEKDRERRYASAAALADDLEAWLAGRPIAARPISRIGKLVRWGRREPALATLACALALLLPMLGALAAYAVLTREDVLAAEAAAFERRIEERLLDGYAKLAEMDWAGALVPFDEVLRSDPASVEAALGAFFAHYQTDTDQGFVFLREGFPPVEEDSFSGRLRSQLLETGLVPDSDGGAWIDELPAPRSAAEHFFAAWMWVDLVRQQEATTTIEATNFLLAPSREKGALERARQHLSCALLLSRSPRLIHLDVYAYVLSHLNAPAAELLAIDQVVASRWPDSRTAQISIGQSLSFPAPRRALELLEGLPEEDRNASVYRSIGVSAGILDDHERAAAAFRRAIELEPGHPMAHYNLGVSLLAMRDFEGMIAANLEAVRLQPTHYHAWSNLALARYHSGDFVAALDACNETLRQAPGHVYALTQAARCLARTGDLAGARAHARAAAEIAARQPEWKADTAGLVAELDALERDSRRLSEWLDEGRVEPDPADRGALANAAFRLGRHEEAEGLFADLFSEHPELAATHRVPAATAAAWAATTGSVDEARAWRERALVWLDEELAAIEREHGAGELEPEQLRERLVPWELEPDLAPLRERRWREPLSTGEENAVREVWARVDALLPDR